MIFNSNCLEVLKSLENKVDLICTDPPYKLTSKGNCGTMGGLYKNKKNTCRKSF